MERKLGLLLASFLIFTFLIAVDATSILLAVFSITTDLQGDTTESFWIGASYLLAMCVSQPIVSSLSDVFSRTSVILSSTLLFGLGSWAAADADSMAILLVGRCVQGLGAGGLSVLSYMTFGDLEHKRGLKFLTAISLFIAAGTVCGPLLGAALSYNSNWRWIFRLNTPVCLVLGILIYTIGDVVYKKPSQQLKALDLDVTAIILLPSSVTLLLVGLSLAGSLYEWSDWRTITPIALGGVCLLLFVGRELCPSLLRRPREKKITRKPLLDLTSFGTLSGASTFIGAMVLGMLMYTLLFFLPIYYRVIKEHSQSAIGLLLLPQTLAIAPCAVIVFVLVEVAGLSYRWAVVMGWLCTTSGIAMLTMLGTNKSVSSDILLNLASGLGIGTLLPALSLSAKDGADNTDSLKAPMLLVFMRYLGSAIGLIVTGILFQRTLQYSLLSTKFRDSANDMTRHATTLMHSIREMPSSSDRDILIRATEDSLRMVWVVMSALSFFIFVLSCFSTLLTAKWKRPSQLVEGASQRETDSSPQLELSADLSAELFKQGEMKFDDVFREHSTSASTGK